MAGIGFQLKELFNERSFFGNVRAYSYSVIVTVGPMFLSILLITLGKLLLEEVSTPYAEVYRYLAAAEYSFIFSQIITGGFAFVISRYVADQTFLEKEEKVLSSMYGLIGICVAIGGISAFLFYASSPLPFSFKLVTYIFFTELIIIWIQSMYVSALKDYKKILKSFLVGTLTSAILIWVTIGIFQVYSATALFICLDIGFLIILLMLIRYIKEYFGVNNHDYFHFLNYIEKYPLLFFCGLFYMFGLYGHNLVVWQGDLQLVIDETFIIAPFYDVPVFYAYLTVLPAMILFMVSVETNFYTVYKKYYGRILNASPLRDILNSKKEMFKTLSMELTFIAEIQLLTVFLSIFLGIQFLPQAGLVTEQIHIFMIVVFGNLFFSLMYTIVLVLLYFDDRQGAFQTTLLYGLTTVIFTLIAVRFEQYGLSLFLASFVCLLFSIKKIVHYLTNIDYYTFCAQPIVYREKETKIGKILEKLS
ncbi:exopolysaccharide Pel transporter PelG [Bacillus timonensis]|nr:exopolysaccharide Pel transporter PelG [Bacillus timonensis]